MGDRLRLASELVVASLVERLEERVYLVGIERLVLEEFRDVVLANVIV